MHLPVLDVLFWCREKGRYLQLSLLVAEWQMAAWIASMLIPFQQWKNAGQQCETSPDFLRLSFVLTEATGSFLFPPLFPLTTSQPKKLSVEQSAKLSNRSVCCPVECHSRGGQ